MITFREEQLLKLKKLIKELEEIRGRHTELVSVYIPSGYNLVEIINQLNNEKSTAMNIKSKTTRKNVLSALEKIISHLRIFKQIPSNGLVVFCGNVSPVEGKEDLRIWSFEPPEKMDTKIYWCDQVFVLEPLKEMVKEKEVYGLVVLDARDANIGLLRGKKIVPLKHLESTVPSKSVKGGMCIHPETLVSLHDGRILQVNELKEHDNPLVCCDLNSFRVINAFHNDIISSRINELIKIKTKDPALEIVTSPDHRFFIFGENGIELKYAKELKLNDGLFTIKRIKIKTSIPKLNLQLPMTYKITREGRKFLIKVTINPELCQLLGYMLGKNTKDKYLLNKYRKSIIKFFKVNTSKRYKKSSYSKELLEIINSIFDGILGKDRKIPEVIQRLPNKYLSKFISGLFDAKGYVNTNGIGITMSTKRIIQTLQLLLLRFGIISSYREELYKGRYMKYRLQISDFDSLIRFRKKINFLSELKRIALNKILQKRTIKSYSEQIPVSSKFIIKLARELKMNTECFPKIRDFFYDRRRKSFRIFKKEVLKYFKIRLKEIKNAKDDNLKKFRKNLRLTLKEVGSKVGCATTTICDLENGKIRNKDLYDKVEKALIHFQKELEVKAININNLLNQIVSGDVILTKVSKILRKKSNETFFDISVPKYENFLANGIVVHNSQMRYDRLREDAINEFLTKVGETASKIFLEQPELKGIIIGGPGPVKSRLIEKDYLHYKLRQKVLGLKDIGYTGEYGLEELVRKSEDLLEKAAIMKERELLQKFFTELQKGGNVVYGYTETIKALNLNAVDTLLISEEFDWVRLKLKCDTGHEVEKDTPKAFVKTERCEICGREMKIELKDDLGELLAERAINFGTKVEFISTDTTEGKQFKELGGIGGFLRYKIS